MSVRDLVRALRSGATLRCPRCEQAPLFRGWFAMHEQCPRCGLTFEREQGYFVGAIYVNYVATVALCLGGFFLVDRWTDLSVTTHIVLWSACGVVFPFLFFRYSRSLWLSLAYLVDPEPQ
jgi:uncharacterized protein (DUF983 family)